MLTNEITLVGPKDLHYHFRDKRNNMLDRTIGPVAEKFEIAVAEPNTKPEIETGSQAMKYGRDIVRAARKLGHRDFHPLTTIYLTNETTPDMIYEASKRGVVAGKGYPRGKTTNSEKGLVNYKAPLLLDVFKAMEETDMRLQLHCEMPFDSNRYIFVLDTVKVFVKEILFDLSRMFPDLQIIVEHLSTRYEAEAVKTLPNV